MTEDLARRIQRVESRRKKAIVLVSIFLVGKLKVTLSKPGTGRVYQKTKPKRIHRASSPGKPPAIDTGMLRRSVHYLLVSEKRHVSAAKVGTPLKYGLYQEYGTSRIRPRPWMRPTIKSNRAKAAAILAKELFK